MRRPALLGFLLFFLLGFLPLAARAQTQTAVSATITDPNGIPYANGTYSIQLIPTGNNPSVGGAAIQGAFNGSLSATGSFSASLWPNASITPASTQWQFTICSNSGGIQPPLGTGTQCTPPTAITISGTAQVLTTTLSNVAPKLTNFITGGTGSVTSVAATSPIVATPSPITGAGTLSCPTCNTSGATIAGSIANTQVAVGTAANTIGGNAGFIFVTPNLTIPVNGSYNIGTTPMLSTPPSGGTPGNNISVGGPSNMSAITNTASGNVAVGSFVMNLTTTGADNTGVGIGALNNEGAAAQQNTAVGRSTLGSVTGNLNTALGASALSGVTSGAQNVGIGPSAGSGLSTGSSNIAVGYQAGTGLTTGSSNIEIGTAANIVTSGSGNVVIGNAPTGITNTASNQFDLMDVIIGTGMNVPATSGIELKGNLTVDGTCTGCGGTPAFSAITSGTNTAAAMVVGTGASLTTSGTGTIATTTQFTDSAAGAASTPALTLSGALFTGGSGTTTFPLLYRNCTGASAVTTWSTSGTTFAANECSGFTGNFLDFHLNGGASLMSISNTGVVTVPSNTTTALKFSAGNVGINSFATTQISFHLGGVEEIVLNQNTNTGEVTTGATGLYDWTATADQGNAAADTGVSRSAAGVVAIGTGAQGSVAGTIKPGKYATGTTCAATGTAANPSVAACGSSAAGMFSCATNASTGTCQVNTTAVTANSSISITQDAADGTPLSVTCNTGNVLSATAPVLASKSAGASFTINLGTVTANPACFEYIIVN